MSDLNQAARAVVGKGLREAIGSTSGLTALENVCGDLRRAVDVLESKAEAMFGPEATVVGIGGANQSPAGMVSELQLITDRILSAALRLERL